MEYYKDYLNAILIIKILFVLLAIVHLYLNLWHKVNPDLDNKVVFWKERVEFVFIFLMSCLMIHLFYPPFNRGIPVSGETKLLLYLFGIVLLITAKWSVFFKESPVFVTVQDIVGVNE